MRRLLLVLFLALGATAQAQARTFGQPELDALLAPVALYPDELVIHILVAAAYPDQVSEAARGVAAQPHWHPSVTALISYPELLQRMAESPQWMHELSQAFIYQQASVMLTVQSLRSRARAQGHLPEPQPAAPVVTVRYYDPLVVFGPWWHVRRPVFWRPWHHHRVFVPHHRHHHRVQPRHHDVHPRHFKPRHPGVRQHVRVPESQRRPIVSSTPQLSQRQFRHQSHRRAQRAPDVRSHSPRVHAGRGGGVHHKPR